MSTVNYFKMWKSIRKGDFSQISVYRKHVNDGTVEIITGKKRQRGDPDVRKKLIRAIITALPEDLWKELKSSRFPSLCSPELRVVFHFDTYDEFIAQQDAWVTRLSDETVDHLYESIGKRGQSLSWDDKESKIFYRPVDRFVINALGEKIFISRMEKDPRAPWTWASEWEYEPKSPLEKGSESEEESESEEDSE